MSLVRNIRVTPLSSSFLCICNTGIHLYIPCAGVINSSSATTNFRYISECVSLILSAVIMKPKQFLPKASQKRSKTLFGGNIFFGQTKIFLHRDCLFEEKWILCQQDLCSKEKLIFVISETKQDKSGEIDFLLSRNKARKFCRN